MKRLFTATTLVALAGAAIGQPLFGQMGRMPMSASPTKPTSFQVTGAMTLPIFSYADFTSSIGWNAQGAIVVRRSAFNHFRLEGEYNSIGLENAGALTGGSEVYGGGIGGGRVLVRGHVQSEGYLVVGAYNHSGAVCVSVGTCVKDSEVQFGTKFGFNAVLGRGQGRVRPVFYFHWLTTYSQPYVNLIAIGGGLRF